MYSITVWQTDKQVGGGEGTGWHLLLSLLGGSAGQPQFTARVLLGGSSQSLSWGDGKHLPPASPRQRRGYGCVSGCSHVL